MPTPDRIRAARLAAALSQTAAGELVGVALRTWQQWEAGDRAMPSAAWELFLLRVGQHPEYRLAKRVIRTTPAGAP